MNNTQIEKGKIMPSYISHAIMGEQLYNELNNLLVVLDLSETAKLEIYKWAKYRYIFRWNLY